jgi:hypothetical protein
MAFRASFASGLTVSRQISGLTGTQYCARVQRNSGNTGTENIALHYALESSQSIPLAGQTVTFSFFARAGANLSDVTLDYSLRSGTGTDQAPQNLSSWTGGAPVSAGAATLTTSWQRFTATATVASNVTQLGFVFTVIPTGTAGANDWFEITGVQLEAGSVATPFKRNAPSIQGELAACQRYYWRNTATSQAFNTLSPFGQASSTTACNISFTPPVTMRATPTSADFSANLRLQDFIAGIAVTNVGIDGGSTPTNPVIAVTVASGLTQFRNYVLSANNSSTSFIGFSAEL